MSNVLLDVFILSNTSSGNTIERTLLPKPTAIAKDTHKIIEVIQHQEEE